MTGEQKPGGLEVAGHFYQTEPGQWTQMNEADGSTVSLTPAEPAEAKIRELEAERDTWKALAENGAQALPRYVTRATAAEAKLARAVEGLEAIRDLGSDGEHSGDRHARCRDFARQTLAALQEAGEVE